ncbi:oxygenase MpaB family protein [Nocardia brasiliensis]|uniref:oxygenase MpaB family protein n=1 Tax=Nocardia brasiliensis TaxID=37326 RepID=UPI0024543272|nr:oxygenase MpaB family protein [Nocardia brasiliensis]
MARSSGPGGLAAELASDWRLLLLAPTALALQVTHPVIGAGVGQYSNYRTDPWGRAARSVWPVLALVMIEDNGYAAQMRQLHRGIGGVDDRGRRYHAWHPEAAYWVLATAGYASEQWREHFATPLTADERDEVFRAWRAAAVDFGIPDRELPTDYVAYQRWFTTIVEQKLENHPTFHELVETLRAPAAPPLVPNWLWRPVARWVIGPLVLLAIGATIPPVLRERVGIEWTARHDRRFALAARAVRIVNTVLPRPLRSINGLIVGRYEQTMRDYIARGAELGIAPSIAAHHANGHVA